MFPTYDKRALNTILRSNENMLSQTIDFILQLNEEEQRNLQNPPASGQGEEEDEDEEASAFAEPKDKKKKPQQPEENKEEEDINNYN
eukprot:CAMPEP_0170545264 /NCGR_PEP_ID=MMETSP0211-20121228/3716_1 /TAXON_ID=311385 /ORGANISM="Pseudokeronopsis sp., Strain OXSARD2" /LENGTH=86 /DNA_ID=CAMNT_0010849119 /DNA_START=47 /DNA_END=307 /DNA_ORIENTATION=+